MAEKKEPPVKRKLSKSKTKEEQTNGGWDSHNIRTATEIAREEFDRTHPEVAERYKPKAPAKRYAEHPTDKIDLNDLTAFLRRNLTLELERSDFTDPNNRRIVLKLEDVEISSVNFSVVQQREYEG